MLLLVVISYITVRLYIHRVAIMFVQWSGLHCTNMMATLWIYSGVDSVFIVKIFCLRLHSHIS